MTNDNAIGIIEVKYKAHEKDLDKQERKMQNFKTLYPIYANYKLYGAITAFHSYEDAKETALERGFLCYSAREKLLPPRVLTICLCYKPAYQQYTKLELRVPHSQAGATRQKTVRTDTHPLHTDRCQ